MKAASTLDYRDIARRRLPCSLFDYIDGGAYSEVTLRRNVEDLERVALRQRALTDVATLDLSTKLFGRTLSLPIALAPIGLAGMSARRGEVQAARAAESAGIAFCLSTVSACSLAEVRRDTTAPFWSQLYMIRDRGFMHGLLAQAREAGCDALLFRVDMPVPGPRYRDYRSGLAGAAGRRSAMRRMAQAILNSRWAWDVGVRGRPHQLGNVAPVFGMKRGPENFFGWIRDNFDPTVSWADLGFIRAKWRGPLIIKGILDVEDARAAVNLGADGIVVSNHGGRQLDGVSSTAMARPPIADAVEGKLVVLADGGVRSGLDVIRMLALGAKTVLLGRAWAYALAGARRAGVEHMLQLVDAEIRIAMALTARPRIADLDRTALVTAAASIAR